mmetsp:Transcript_100547/g.288917  ORF Transcript_100547/g.288917 Transcript_100547/m.288917 type:complete len:305 (+) Transcript_100547:256-1170(+)
MLTTCSKVIGLLTRGRCVAPAMILGNSSPSNRSSSNAWMSSSSSLTPLEFSSSPERSSDQVSSIATMFHKLLALPAKVASSTARSNGVSTVPQESSPSSRSSSLSSASRPAKRLATWTWPLRPFRCRFAGSVCSASWLRNSLTSLPLTHASSTCTTNLAGCHFGRGRNKPASAMSGPTSEIKCSNASGDNPASNKRKCPCSSATCLRRVSKPLMTFARSSWRASRSSRSSRDDRSLALTWHSCMRGSSDLLRPPNRVNLPGYKGRRSSRTWSRAWFVKQISRIGSVCPFSLSACLANWIALTPM